MLFAQTLGLAEIVSGGPWLVVAWVMWHLLTKRMPAQDAAVKEMGAKIDKLRETIGKLQDMLIHHDATVRGENPEVSSTHEEMKQLGGKEP